MAGGGDKGIGDAATHNQLIDTLGELIQHGDLARDLRAANDRHQRPVRRLQRLAQRLELGGQQRPGHRIGGKPRDTVGRGLGTMGGAEGIHDKQIAERGHAPRQGLVVVGLAGVEAHVLAEHDPTGIRHGIAVKPVPHHRDLTAQQLAQPGSHRRHRGLGIERPGPGAAEMAHHHDPGTRRHQPLQGRQRSAQARLIADAPVLQRHVQILADQHALAGEGDIIQGANRHYLAFIMASAVSSMRFEKPHSLSYQAQALTSRPLTLVRVASKVEECASWLKSTDT